MSEQTAERGSERKAPRAWPVGVMVAVVAVGWFGYRLRDEPAFVDESAYVAQGYFFDLAVNGQVDDWAWVEYHAYDLPPLPKYLIGASLKVAGDRPPGRIAAGQWFRDTKSVPIAPRVLTEARWPSVILGAVGCVAIFAIGCQLQGRVSGVLAAGLLMVDPLYQMHARRAMSDVPAEALILTTLAVGLWGWRRVLGGWWGLVRGGVVAVATGVLAGLAVLAKLNGGLALMTVGAWSVLGLGLKGFSRRGRVGLVGMGVVSAVVGLGTFVGLNPFVYAHPEGRPPVMLMAPAGTDQTVLERLWVMVGHRAVVSRDAQRAFPGDALETASEKVKAVVVQGFGRFGPLGPRDHSSTTPYPRYSWERDWSALVWGPLVGVGVVWSVVSGFGRMRAGGPPVEWAVLVYFGVALGTVTAFIPLAWDRYYLSIQAPGILLVTGAVGAGLSAVGRRVRGTGDG